MLTTAYLGLKVWNDPGDPYDSAQLGENWLKVDQHDHTEGKGVRIGTSAISDAAITQAKIAPGVLLPVASITPGQVGTTELADLSVTTGKLANNAVTTAKTADSAITTAKLGTSAVTSAKITDGTVTDLDLASPNNGSWRTFLQGTAKLPSGLPIDTYACGTVVSPAGGVLGASSVLNFDSADALVAGKTTQLRLRAVYIGNTVSSATTRVDAALYPVTGGSGSGGAVSLTFGSRLGSSVVSMNALASDSGTSSIFTFPSNGFYALGFSVSVAAVAANHAGVLTAQLQLRNG